MNLAKFPRRGYVQAPTPLEYLPNFSKALGNKVNVFIKRDDLLPGCAGGNKTRKLDYCVAEALAQGADTLITCGALQSNHCRLTLAWAVKEGMDCHLVLEECIPGTYDPKASANNLLFHLLGAKSIMVLPKGTSKQQEMESLASELKEAGRKPAIVPMGASSITGTLGYVACAQELVQQAIEQRINMHSVIVASGSAGTQAGLVVGMEGTNARIPVLGVNVISPKKPQEALVGELVAKTAQMLELPTIPASAVMCYDTYLGAGYLIPTPEMVEAVQLLAQTEAILLDPIYSGKAMAGLIGMVRNNVFPQGSNVVFIHTGGSPALHVYADCFLP